MPPSNECIYDITISILFCCILAGCLWTTTTTTAVALGISLGFCGCCVDPHHHRIRDLAVPRLDLLVEVFDELLAVVDVVLRHRQLHQHGVVP